MTLSMTREQAQATSAAATAERDTIQANLLDLDGSFGKRLLAGATLTGRSRDQWDQAAAALAGLWDAFAAYSAVIDRAAEILAAPGRLQAARLDEAASLLTGPSVRLTRAIAPLSQRELTSGGETRFTLQFTVREMRRSFSEVAKVLTAAETVWNEISDGIRQVATQIETAKRQLPGLGDAELAGGLTQAENSLTELRNLLNSDPLALWNAGQVDASRLGRLRQQAAAAAAYAQQQQQYQYDPAVAAYAAQQQQQAAAAQAVAQLAVAAQQQQQQAAAAAEKGDGEGEEGHAAAAAS